MTDIDPKALEHACQCAGRSVHHFDRMALDLPLRASIVAHARAIEQHEAFKLEVSEFALGTKEYMACVGANGWLCECNRFIIAKRDPLVEAVKDCQFASLDAIEDYVAKKLRAALAARGLKIVEVDYE